MRSNWWGQPPAILKGWIDRVLRPGVAYDYPAGAGPEAPAIGLLHTKAAFERRMFGPMASSMPAQREAWLAEVRAVVSRHA